jgi:hypothetical protein
LSKGAKPEQTESMGSAPLHLPARDDLVRLEHLYTFCGRNAVLDFLSSHQTLMALLLEAAGQIRARFPDARMSLEVVMDYDVPTNDAQKRLMMSIATDLEPARAVIQLNDLYASWWFTAPGDGRKWLAFGLESV